MDKVETTSAGSKNIGGNPAASTRPPSIPPYSSRIPRHQGPGPYNEASAGDFGAQPLRAGTPGEFARYEAIFRAALQGEPTPEIPPHLRPILENHRSLASLVRNQAQWMAHFPEVYHNDIAFLLTHPSGRNLASHSCMGASHTHAHRTADHKRGLHINLSIEVAIEMAERLRLTETEARDCVMAVAVHDQGHIFASHQSEAAINSFPEFQGTPGNPQFCHEHRTKDLLSSDEFVRHFGQQRIGRMKGILYDVGDPMHLFVDWADRLAYLIADPIFLGDEELIRAGSVRRQFIESLVRLDDGSIGFSSLDPVSTLISARDKLYCKYSVGPAATLFGAFMVEAYHRAVDWKKVSPTQFVNMISQLPTPEAVKLFHPEDQKHLLCPQQHPDLARPVDREYAPVARITFDMLSPLGKKLAVEGTCVSPEESTPGFLKPRAGVSVFENTVRKHFALNGGGPGYLERTKCLVPVASISKKFYHLKHATEPGEIQPVTFRGKEHWEMFVAIPAENAAMAHMLNREVARALTEAGLIDQTKDAAGYSSILQRLTTVPSADLLCPPER